MLQHISISPVERKYIVDLEPFMNTSPYTVHEVTTLSSLLISTLFGLMQKLAVLYIFLFFYFFLVTLTGPVVIILLMCLK
jgi:hypothetical protein